MREAVTFLASFPSIQSAIKIGPDGMRIQLDVPETEMGSAVQLLAWREVVLKVTIEPDVTDDRRDTTRIDGNRPGATY